MGLCGTSARLVLGVLLDGLCNGFAVAAVFSLQLLLFRAEAPVAWRVFGPIAGFLHCVLQAGSQLKKCAHGLCTQFVCNTMLVRVCYLQVVCCCGYA